MPLNTDQEIKELLKNSRTIAVVGYSDKPDRPSNEVTHALKRFGYEVYPINPTVQSTPEQPVFASLTAVPIPIDIVDIFRRPEAIPEVVEEAIKVGAKAIWMQLGIVNEDAAAQAEAAGLKVVMDHCTKIEHKRLID